MCVLWQAFVYFSTPSISLVVINNQCKKLIVPPHVNSPPMIVIFGNPHGFITPEAKSLVAQSVWYTRPRTAKPIPKNESFKLLCAAIKRT